MFTFFSNGVGRDDDEVRNGNTMFIDCYGRNFAETWKAEDAIVIADLDRILLDRCTGSAGSVLVAQRGSFFLK